MQKSIATHGTMHGLTPLHGMLIGRWAWHISHRLWIFLIKKALMYVYVHFTDRNGAGIGVALLRKLQHR